MSGNPLLAGKELVSSLIISNDEYAELIEAKTQLDMIIAIADEKGYGACDIIKAVKKTREPVVTVSKGEE